LLSNLRGITWELGDLEDSFISVDKRNSLRIKFAEGIQKLRIRCPAFRIASVKFHRQAPVGHELAGPTILPLGKSYDPFYAALRTLSQTLTLLKFSAHLDATLLWPSPDEPDIATPCWPSLRELEVEFDSMAPFGEWYFTGICRDNHKESNEAYWWSNFCYCPDFDTFTSFIAAFARAVSRCRSWSISSLCRSFLNIAIGPLE
jgi:hypothetical protein